MIWKMQEKAEGMDLLSAVAELPLLDQAES
jgi:hypothetical protein